MLCVGYALDLLGGDLPEPIHALTALTPQELVARLRALPWDGNAWHGGATVDTLGTALLRNLRRGEAPQDGVAETLFGWLHLRADPRTLQGTEMWLAIIWLLADLAGLSPALGYRPRGVHRPEPGGRLE